MRGALAFFLLLLASGPLLAAEPLGRLFYTPAQRAQLDQLRSQKVVAQPVVEEEPQPVPEVVTYGGIVRRSDGKTTVWINNRPLHDAKAIEQLPISGRIRPDNSVSVRLPQADRSIDLKVGQSVDIGSGAIAESYRRRSEPTPPPARADGARKPETPRASTPNRPQNSEDDGRIER